MRHHAFRPFVIASLLAVAAAGCSSSGDDANSSTPNDESPATSAEPSTSETSSSDASVPEDEFSFSVSIGEPAAIDPGLAQEVEGLQVTRLLFETLTTLTPELELASGGALEWSASDDGLTWTFDLDPAATFSDGRPVVAEDDAFAFARSADPDFAAPASYRGSPIAGWAAVLDRLPELADGPEADPDVVARHTAIAAGLRAGSVTLDDALVAAGVERLIGPSPSADPPTR